MLAGDTRNLHAVQARTTCFKSIRAKPLFLETFNRIVFLCNNLSLWPFVTVRLFSPLSYSSIFTILLNYVDSSFDNLQEGCLPQQNYHRRCHCQTNWLWVKTNDCRCLRVLKYRLVLRGNFFQCHVFAMESVQNLKSFWRSSQNYFVLALFSSL
jgi:hypothetical protein